MGQAKWRAEHGGQPYGEDRSHPNRVLREPPKSLIALREELPKHQDVYNRAILGNTFEECLGIIATDCGIVLDGLYDAADLCDLLTKALQARRKIIVVDSTELIPKQVNPADMHPGLVPLRFAGPTGKLQ